MLRFDRNKIGTQPKNDFLYTITDNWTKLLLTGISPQNSELNAKASKQRATDIFRLPFRN